MTVKRRRGQNGRHSRDGPTDFLIRLPCQNWSSLSNWLSACSSALPLTYFPSLAILLCTPSPPPFACTFGFTAPPSKSPKYSCSSCIRLLPNRFCLLAVPSAIGRGNYKKNTTRWVVRNGIICYTLCTVKKNHLAKVFARKKKSTDVTNQVHGIPVFLFSFCSLAVLLSVEQL